MCFSVFLLHLCSVLCSPACFSLHTCPASAVLARPSSQQFFPPACQPSSSPVFFLSSFHLSRASLPISPPVPLHLVGLVCISVQLSVQSRCAPFTCSSRCFWITVPLSISQSAVFCNRFNLPCSQYNMCRQRDGSAHTVFLCSEGFLHLWWSPFGFDLQMTRVFNNPPEQFLHAAWLFVFLVISDFAMSQTAVVHSVERVSY